MPTSREYSVNVDASLSFAPPSLSVDAQVGNLPLGNSGVVIPGPTLMVTANASGVKVEFTGSFSDSHTGINLAATVNLDVSTSLSSLANAEVDLTVAGGQPSYLAAGVSLTGNVVINSGGFNLAAYGDGYLDVNNQNLGTISWSYNLTSGLFWQDLVDAANTVAAWFESIPGWTDQQYTSRPPVAQIRRHPGGRRAQQHRCVRRRHRPGHQELLLGRL